MFTLKLYQNGINPMVGRTIIIETVGLWVDACDNGVKHIQAFRKAVGVQDDGGTPEFYVGGNIVNNAPPNADAPPSCIVDGVGGNWFTYGILENAQGKTTEMFR